jgi:hypothetical protein
MNSLANLRAILERIDPAIWMLEIEKMALSWIMPVSIQQENGMANQVGGDSREFPDDCRYAFSFTGTYELENLALGIRKHSVKDLVETQHLLFQLLVR